MSIKKEDLDIENPFNNLKLFWNAGKENWKNREHIVRMTTFYSKYQPSKINSITSLLAKYEGRELEMYNNIYKKYGVDALTPSDRKQLENTYVLTEYYKIHNPEKLSDVPNLIKKYEDDADLLFKKMEKKYGTDPRNEIALPEVAAVPASPVPVKEEKEEYSYSDYSDYSDEEQKPTKPSLQRDVKEGDSGFFSSFIESSKKLFVDLSNAGVKPEAGEKKQSKVVQTPTLGKEMIANDKEIQASLKSSTLTEISNAVDKVDNSLSMLVGAMQEEEQLWRSLRDETSVNQSAIISTYQTRLNSLMERVKAIEMVLTNCEEGVERDQLEAWKNEKTKKLGMLQNVYEEQLGAREEELKELSEKEVKPAEPVKEEPAEPVNEKPAEPVNEEPAFDDLSDDDDL